MRVESYDYKAIEAKWQKIWKESGTFRSGEPDPKKKFYCLVMFPYPSGKIHMGHARNYCIGDVIARIKKMHGYRVLHPLGWDAFGLPAENAAIQNGVDPGEWTRSNIRDMRQDIQSLGISYDWSREFATCDEDYYRWNQWFFVRMFKKGLAYRKKSAVNWCPSCETVLANEQVHDGKCWRCGSDVSQKDLNQWFFKILDYADRLLEDLKILEGHWPDEVITMQRNWIGKSTGAEIDFDVRPESKSGRHGGSGEVTGKIKVFTTRPDTLCGCTFLVLSPEHPFAQSCLTAEHGNEVREYIQSSKSKTRIERTSPQKEKTGVFTGSYAVNPLNGSPVPIWLADYVLSDYGTGAIMAVPAHDQRDFEFAKKFGIPIVEVVEPLEKDRTARSGKDLESAYEGEGVLVNSGEFSGQLSKEASKKIAKRLSANGQGGQSVSYRIRDWLLSRQRYWGTPIPILYCPDCGMVPVPEEDLPVVLPGNVQFTGKGQSPLSQISDYVNTRCPQCGKEAKRETDSMDTFVDSSWYYLRYTDPHYQEGPFNPKNAEPWMPVDQYIGGIEHACMHLIYSRFFHKVAYDLGLVQSKEPFLNLLTQGMVTMDGSAMSKSKGNAVPVEDMIDEYGADTARVFVLFASPPRNQLEWSDEGVQGAWRFLNRVWRLSRKIAEGSKGQLSGSDGSAPSVSLLRKMHQTIKKVDQDIERDFQFNTALSALMELLNMLSDYPDKGDPVSVDSFRILLILLFPFAPHLSSEIWQGMDFKPQRLDDVPFPVHDPDLVQEKIIEIVVQVNGKYRSKVSVPRESADRENEVIAQAEKSLAGKGLGAPLNDAVKDKKYKFVPGRLVNFIVKSGLEVKK